MRYVKGFIGFLLMLIGIVLLFASFISLFSGLFLGVLAADCGPSIMAGWAECQARGNPGLEFLIKGALLALVLGFTGYGLNLMSEKLLGPLPADLTRR